MSKERPILFSAPMVLAILEGRKTQTRRVMKPQPVKTGSFWEWAGAGWSMDVGPIYPVPGHSLSVRCPYGQPGDLLWVRETWQGYRRTSYEYDEWEPMDSPKDRHENTYSPVYRADEKNYPDKWFPAIHMPREFSRITLRIKSVRVERLNQISRDDAIAEGGPPSSPSIDTISRAFGFSDFSRSWFGQLWEFINGAGSWEANPWIWVIEFERVTVPEVAP